MKKSITVRLLVVFVLSIVLPILWSVEAILDYIPMYWETPGNSEQALENIPGFIVICRLEAGMFIVSLILYFTFSCCLRMVERNYLVKIIHSIKVVFYCATLVMLYVIISNLINDFLNYPILTKYAIRYTIVPTILLVGLGLGPVLFTYQFERIKGMRWYRRRRIGGGGSAIFGSLLSFIRNKMEFVGSNINLRSYMLYLGRPFFLDDPFQRPIGVKNNAHLITIGMTGSGKSTTSASNNLALYLGSMIVMDPKGEHARMTYKRRTNWEMYPDYGWYYGARDNERTPSECYMLDPFGINAHTDLPSHRYNPMADIPLFDEGRAFDMIEAIADGCVIPESKDTHFSDHARKFIFALIGHVLTKYPKENHNLPFIYDLFYGIDTNTGIANPKLFDDLLIDMCTNNALGNKINAAGRDLLEMGDNERGSVLSTIAKSMEWIAEPSMRKQLSASDFTLQGFGTKRADCYEKKRKFFKTRRKYLGKTNKIETLYIVLPFNKIQSQSRWMRILSSVSIQVLTTAPNKPHTPTVILLDEFAQMGGKVQSVVNAFNIARSAKVKLWIMLQNLGQIKDQYKEWNDMISGSTVQLFGVNDMATGKYFSERLGNMVVSRTERTGGRYGLGSRRIASESLRPLYAPDELMELLGKEENTQIIFMPSGRPLFLRRVSHKKYKTETNGVFRPIRKGGGIEHLFSYQYT